MLKEYLSNVAQALHRQLALLVNERSRRARKEPHFIEQIETALGDRGLFVQSKSPSELPEVMSNIRRTEPDLVMICGGDGTLRQTLTHLIAAYGDAPLPKIAILRGGTMNTVATSLGIFRTPLEQLQLILDRLSKGYPLATARRHMLKMNQYFGFIFALGGFSRFIQHYNSQGDPTPFHAFKLVSKTIFSTFVNGPLASSFFQPFATDLEENGTKILNNEPITNLACSSIRHIGFRFKPFYGAEDPGGKFGLLIFRKSPRRLLFHLMHFYRGELISDPDVIQMPSASLTIKVENPMAPMLDGDVLGAGKTFSLQAGPALEMVIG